MSIKLTDTIRIAEELNDKFPDVDPMTVRFVDLHNWVVELDGFDDDHSRGGERVLEAIQMAWIEEAK
jgi:FeS assembly protein IscX